MKKALIISLLVSFLLLPNFSGAEAISEIKEKQIKNSVLCENQISWWEKFPNFSLLPKPYSEMVTPMAICSDKDNDGLTKEDGDCNDHNPLIYPGAEEVCGDGIDQDCNGEDYMLTWYIDYDSDNYGDDYYILEQCNQPNGYVDNADDCNDNDSEINPGALEYCDEVDNDCNDIIDDDYSEDAPAWYADADGDTYGNDSLTTLSCEQPENYISDNTDCDDTDNSIYPSAEEICGDGIDQDCNGEDSICIIEPWNKVYGGNDMEWGYSAQQTMDGGFIMVGNTNSFGAGDNDIWIVKTDSSGKEEWTKTYGTVGFERAYFIQQTNNNGYAIAGFKKEYGADEWQALILKIDDKGNEEWNRSYGGHIYDYAGSIQQTSDNGYIVTGKINNNLWLAKFDINGNEEWEKFFSSSYGGVYGSFSQETSDGGYITIASSGFISVIKTDASGNEMWSYGYNGNPVAWGYSIQQTSDGGYILVGSTYMGDQWHTYAIIIKIDNTGNEEWRRTFGDSDIEYSESIFYSVKETPEGDFIVAGKTDGIEGDAHQGWLYKFDSIGNEKWHRIYGSDVTSDFFYSVAQVVDGGYIIGGTTYSWGSGGADFWLMKTDSEGNAPEEPM